jgi:hypothetical protein
MEVVYNTDNPELLSFAGPMRKFRTLIVEIRDKVLITIPSDFIKIS